MARRAVKKVSSLQQTARELRKSRQETGTTEVNTPSGKKGPQTITETNTKTGKKKSITMGAPGEVFGAFGFGQGGTKAKKPKKNGKKS